VRHFERWIQIAYSRAGRGRIMKAVAQKSRTGTSPAPVLQEHGAILYRLAIVFLSRQLAEAGFQPSANTFSATSGIRNSAFVAKFVGSYDSLGASHRVDPLFKPPKGFLAAFHLITKVMLQEQGQRAELRMLI
jgi:hypothetical protein